jgi:hypothetical protein
MDLTKYVCWDILIPGKASRFWEILWIWIWYQRNGPAFLLPKPKVTSKDSNAIPLNAVKPLIYTKFSMPVTIKYI